MEKPLISVVIPFYNVENYIARCLDSVIHQTYENIEIILIDDCSTDQSFEIAKKHLLRFPQINSHIICFETNQGQGAARNAGIKKAKGDYIYFIDSDDWLANEVVFALFMSHLETDSYDFLGAALQLAYEDGKTFTYNATKHPSEITEIRGNDIFLALIDNVIPAIAGNFLYSSEFLKQNNLFFEEGIKHEDELWMFRICINSQRCLLLPEVTYNYYRSNPNSTMNNIGINNLNNIEKIAKDILNINDCLLLHKKIGTNKFSVYLDRFYYNILKDKNLIHDYPNWVKFYRRLKKHYSQSETSSILKKFRLPPYLAYILLLEKMKKPSKIRNRFYRSFLNKLSVV